MITINEKENIRKYGKEIICIRGLRFYEGYYQRKRCYGVQQLSTGYCAVFNHRKQILDLLMDLISNGANLCRDYKGNMCIVYGSKKYMALAMFLYCAYIGVRANETVFENNIRHRERKRKMIEDCRIANLYIGGSSVYFDKMGKSIMAVSNTDEFTDVFSPVPVIADILKGCSSLQANIGDRVMAKYKGEHFPVGDLAYLAYYDGDLTADNFIEKRQALKKYKEENGLTLEHLDGDFHNHRKYNIVLVNETLNSRKNDKISRIVEPFCFTAVFDKPYHSGIESGGQFKILIGKFDDDLMLTVDKRFITDCFENVVNMLDIYMAEYPKRVDKVSALQNNERLIFHAGFAEQLAKEPDEHFVCLDNL